MNAQRIECARTLGRDTEDPTEMSTDLHSQVARGLRLLTHAEVMLWACDAAEFVADAFGYSRAHPHYFAAFIRSARTWASSGQGLLDGFALEQAHEGGYRMGAGSVHATCADLLRRVSHIPSDRLAAERIVSLAEGAAERQLGADSGDPEARRALRERAHQAVVPNLVELLRERLRSG